MNPPRQTTHRKYESILDAATRVGVSTKTVRRWISTGHLHGYRMGPRLLRVDPDELDRMWILIPTVAKPVSVRGTRQWVS